ncbi:MAG TPA: LuxR C-terminal-related transcriptional regulator [Solirubrobacteraceae bacterium]|nr:LuxR C-terminal-related transcriptional regulator [Solirubrobacteraceae bacterium]
MSIGAVAATPWVGSHASGDATLLAAVAELATATTEELAERARSALAPVLPHQALVILAPNAESLPVRIAAPDELRQRLAAIDWTGLIGGEIAAEDGASRIAVPDAIAGLRPGAWVAGSGGSGIALIVGSQHHLEIGPAQEWIARLVATLIAAHEDALAQAPSAKTLAFSHAISQERDRVRWELLSRHAATLTALLKTLRVAAQNGSRATPPGVAMAIDLASQALLEVNASDKREDTSLTQPLSNAFAEADAELRTLVRAEELRLIIGLEDDDRVVPRAIARAAGIVSRVGVLNATAHPGADKLRVHWRANNDSLAITIADNGDGFRPDDPQIRSELHQLDHRVASLGGEVEFDSTPRWGTTVTCTLPLRSLSIIPETPAAGRIADLRPREREVLELMVGGMRNREIAERLFITIRTVKFHVSNILRKLDVQSRTEVIILAHNAGISAPEDG